MTQDTRTTSRITDRLSRLASRALSVNPIIIKEMRAQVRGPRAFWILTGYLLGLGLLAYGLYRITLNSVSQYYGPGAPSQSAFIGQTLFIGLAFLEMTFVCFITPALTAGAISGETERLTSDVLLATPLRAASIVFGKTFASLTYIQLLILAAIPLSSVVFLFGGVALRDVVQVIGLLALTAITYGTMGIFFSALTRRTGRATALSYSIVLAIIFGSVFSWAITNTTGRGAPPRQIFYVNPFSALASAVITQQVNNYYSSPVTSLLFMLGGGPEAMGFYTTTVPARPIWQYTVALYMAVTAVLYLLTTQLVKPVRRWRIGWRGVVVLVLVLAVLAGGLWFTFGTAWGSTGWQAPGAPTDVSVIMPSRPVEVIVERVIEVTVEVPPQPPPEPTPPPPPQPSPTPIPPPLTPLAGTVRVNFQPLTSTVPADYLVDSGEVYGDRGDGFVYGWDVPNPNTRQRSAHSDQRYDTLNHMQKSSPWGAVWEMAVPNGMYKVTLVMGDAVFSNQVNDVIIEDVVLKDATPDAHDFDTYADVVATVSDERLTIRAAAGAENAKVCFVEIAPLTEAVQNPGFEDGPHDPGEPPPDWRADVVDPLSIMTWDDAEAHSGNYSVRTTSAQPNDARWIQTVKVAPETDYVLSGWIKTEDVVHGGGAVEAGANLDVFGTWDHTSALLGTNDWTYVEVAFNSGSNTELEIACRLGYWSSVASGTVWCDDIELRRK